MSLKITFVDLETTGLNSEEHEIIELAAVKTEVSNDKLVVLYPFECRVQPKNPVDPFVARLNGYSKSEWETYSLPLEDGLFNVFDMMQDSWHAGSNPKFDEAFLKKAAKDLHWQYPKLASHHLLDVSTLAFSLLIDQEIDKLNQENVAKYYGIEGGGHRAMADVHQCLKIFARINNLEIINKY